MYHNTEYRQKKEQGKKKKKKKKKKKTSCKDKMNPAGQALSHSPVWIGPKRRNVVCIISPPKSVVDGGE
jgi:hypothetical protein